MPTEIRSQKNWEIAIAQIEEAMAWGVRHHPVPVDAGYVNSTEFRATLERLILPYVVDVSGNHAVYPLGTVPYLPLRKTTRKATFAAS